MAGLSNIMFKFEEQYHRHLPDMKSLIVIDSCVRQSDSRTLRIAEPVIEALGSLWNLGELTTIAAQNMDYSSAEALELAERW